MILDKWVARGGRVRSGGKGLLGRGGARCLCERVRVCVCTMHKQSLRSLLQKLLYMAVVVSCAVCAALCTAGCNLLAVEALFLWHTTDKLWDDSLPGSTWTSQRAGSLGRTAPKVSPPVLSEVLQHTHTTTIDITVSVHKEVCQGSYTFDIF